MPTPTVAEKDHRRDRIAARIDEANERIRARHPALSGRVRREANAEALRSSGLNNMYAELESIRAGEAELARREESARRPMLAALRGGPPDEVSDNVAVRFGGDLSLPAEAHEAIARRLAAGPERMPADDSIGRALARLGAEEAVLLDTIRPATSPAENRSLGSRVSELLGDEPTHSGREALAIAPAGEG